MEIKILKNEEITRLQEDIKDNINKKRYGVMGFKNYIDTSKITPLKNTNFNEGLFSQLALDKGGAQDATNASIIYKSLEGLTPYNARDNRVWTYLSHTSGLRFALRDISDIEDREKKINAVKKEFFIQGNSVRVFASRHSLSKLWWAAHLCSTHSALPLDKALEVFCTQSDFRASVIERPNTYLEPAVFRAMLNVAKKRWSGSLESSFFFRRKENESPYRDWHKLVNRHGGARLLSVLDGNTLEGLLEKAADQGEKEFRTRWKL
jgi:hypothetical protein